MSVLDNLKALASFAQKSKDPELIGQVITLQSAYLELLEQVQNLEKENEELKKHLELKGKITFQKPFYFMEGDEEPFCPLCWENTAKAIHLIGPKKVMAGFRYNCPNCDLQIMQD